MGGYDYSNETSVEIESGNLVREGETIDVYDNEAGEYRQADVYSIENNGSYTEVEVYDYEAGEYRTFEMNNY